MSKKKEQEEVFVNKYPLVDALRIENLKKITHPNKDEMDQIYEFYKKYINPVQPMYRTNCSCSSNIVGLYWKLLEWFDKNKNLFYDK